MGREKVENRTRGLCVHWGGARLPGQFLVSRRVLLAFGQGLRLVWGRSDGHGNFLRLWAGRAGVQLQLGPSMLSHGEGQGD